MAKCICNNNKNKTNTTAYKYIIKPTVATNNTIRELRKNSNKTRINITKRHKQLQQLFDNFEKPKHHLTISFCGQQAIIHWCEKQKTKGIAFQIMQKFLEVSTSKTEHWFWTFHTNKQNKKPRAKIPDIQQEDMKPDSSLKLVIHQLTKT